MFKRGLPPHVRKGSAVKFMARPAGPHASEDNRENFVFAWKVRPRGRTELACIGVAREKLRTSPMLK
eukprot:122578-Pleurochrysis_carterae.AAC.2